MTWASIEDFEAPSNYMRRGTDRTIASGVSVPDEQAELEDWRKQRRKRQALKIFSGVDEQSSGAVMPGLPLTRAALRHEHAREALEYLVAEFASLKADAPISTLAAEHSIKFLRLLPRNV